jgi:large subunit ribosomal protein L28
VSRVCQLTGKAGKSGHNVAHSNRKTNRRFVPNIQKVTLHSEALKRDVSLRVSTRALRTVQKRGGLDAFLVKAAEQDLGETGLRLKRKIRKALTGPRPVAS